MKPHEVQIVVTVAIAIGTVILVPLIKRMWGAWQEAQHARLAKVFALREDIEAKFDELQQRQDKQHAENREVLDRIRTEAHQREGKILGSIQAVSNQNRGESARLGTDIATIAQRVDRVFERLAGAK